MGKTIAKSTVQKDLARAEELMRVFAQVQANKNALMATIKNELDIYAKHMKEAEAELLEIGARNRDEFNDDGNLVLEDGYIHIQNSAVVVTGKKFDVGVFSEAHPELIDINLKKGEIKKAFQDKAFRKELKALGVDIDNEEKLQVIANKKD